MTSEELQAARAARWQALQPAPPSPAALHAWLCALGIAELPELEAWSPDAPQWLEAELAALRAIELAVWPGVHRYIAVELLEFVYVAVGDRHPRADYRRQASRGTISWLAAEVYERLLAAPAALSPAALRDQLGAERISVLAVERALAELAPSLKVLPVGPQQWRALVTALPQVPGALDRLSQSQAAAALVSQWLDVRVCDTEAGIAAYFAPLFPRTRIHDVLMALESTRQLTLDSLDGQPAFRRSPRPLDAPAELRPPR